MRIAVLEWICGGGLVATPHDEIPRGLRIEGWQMLSTLVEGLAMAQQNVVTVIDARVVNGTEAQRIRQLAEVLIADPLDYHRTANSWREIAAQCDATIVIAPEIDNVLVDVIGSLAAAGVELINCTADFLLNASDKHRTALCFEQAHIPHPPTRLLSDVDEDWLVEVQCLGSQSPPQWMLKPTDGAGGEGILTFNHADFMRYLEPAGHQSPDAKRWIVQPRLRGIHASRSAIVDSSGVCHWLPLVSQDFAASPESEGRELSHYQKFQYHGFTLPPAGVNSTPAGDVLNAAVAALGAGALGWIGFDLLFDPKTAAWVIIEVNPRLTSSFVGLSRAFEGNLSQQLIEPLGSSNWQAKFRPFRFRQLEP